jgi:hypothetical protein
LACVPPTAFLDRNLVNRFCHSVPNLMLRVSVRTLPGKQAILKGMRLAVFALVLFLPACDQVRDAEKSLGDVLKVQQAVMKATGQQDINVVLNNGHYPGIGLVNSTWASLAPDAKAAKAREIAALAVSAYPDRASLSQINVTCSINRTYFLIFHYTNTTDSYPFNPADGHPRG